MKATGALDYTTVLEAVRAWPAVRRLTLVRDVLETLAPELEAAGIAGADAAARRREALRRLRGIGSAAAPPPSDAEVQQWLEEERVKKYG